MRDFLRSFLVGACGLCAAPLAAVSFTAAPATASAAGPQRSATPNVTAEIAYASGQVHPGGQDTMTVSLVNHGPQSLDDHSSVHVTVTMPQDTEVSPNVLETVPGNAPAGSRNAVPSRRSLPIAQMFVRSAPDFLEAVVPAGSFGNSASFRTYTFTLRVSPTVTQGSQLVGGGVAVALENYVGLTVAKSVMPPAPVVVAYAPKPPAKSGKQSKPDTPNPSGNWGTPYGAGSSEWMQRGGPVTWTGCAGVPMTRPSSAGAGNPGAGGVPSGGAATGGAPSSGGPSGGAAPGGPRMCTCSVDQHVSPNSGGSTRCIATGLAETGFASTWPLALGVLALAAGMLLRRVARRRNGNWSRP